MSDERDDLFTVVGAKLEQEVDGRWEHLADLKPATIPISFRPDEPKNDDIVVRCNPDAVEQIVELARALAEGREIPIRVTGEGQQRGGHAKVRKIETDEDSVTVSFGSWVVE